MSDSHGRLVGIRLRFSNGRKFSVRGGREGLFIPSEIEPEAESILFCEGPTDTAALLDLGFCALGRPSCTGGTKYAVEFVRNRNLSKVIVVADADAPGVRGGEALAQVLSLYAREVKLIIPPLGIKDARDWKRAGAKAKEVQAAIDAAPTQRVPLRFLRRG